MADRPSTRFLRSLAAAALVGGALLAHAAVDDKASRFYEDALVRYEKRDFSGAVIQLKNALQIDRRQLPAHVLLGKALLADGNPAAAEVAMNEAVRLGVDRTEVVVPLARAYVAQGKQRAFVEQAQFAPDGLPPEMRAQVLLLRSVAFADLGDARAALQAVDEVKTLDARSPEPWIAEVPVRIRTREFKEAATAIERALALAPNSAEAWHQKGAVAHARGSVRDAAAAYDKALSIDPDHVEARVARAGLRMDQGQFADVAKDLDELRRVSPKDVRAAYLRAMLAERDGDVAGAKVHLHQITALLDPVPLDFIRYRPQMLVLNGLAHFSLDEREKAKPYFEAAQRLQGTTPVSKLLAQIYYGEKSVNRSIEILESYVRAIPGDSQALTLLASAYMAQGNNAKATALLQEALRIRDTPALRTALGFSLIGGGQEGSGGAELESAFKDPRQVNAGAALATLYIKGGQKAKAVATAQKLVAQQPANAGFHNLLGLAYGVAGDIPKSRAAFEKAIQLDPKLAEPRLNLARIDIATGAYDAAAKRLADILQTTEGNVDAMMEQAALATARGQPAETKRWLEKAQDVAGPRNLRPGLALVDFHLRNSDGAAAMETLKKLSARSPDSVPLQLATARTQLLGEDVVGARATLANATGKAGFNPDLQLEIAVLQMQSGNLAGAAESLERGLSGSPKHLPSQALMTEVELKQGQAGKAEARARRIVDAYPKRAIGHSLTGDVAAARGQPAAALDAYRRAHQIEPSSDTLLRLVRAMAAGGQAKAALPLAEQWIKAHPRDLVVRRALSGAQAGAGNYAAARAGYEAILKIAPDDPEALNDLANVLIRQKDPAALKVAEQAAAKRPGDPNVADTLGWALHHSGQPERALPLLRDARLRNPRNPEIRYHLAAALAQAGRKGEAKEELESALKTGMAFSGRDDAETLLRSLRL